MGPLAWPAATAVAVAVTARWATGGLPDVAAAPLSVMVAGLAYVTVASVTGVAEARSLITDIRGVQRRLGNR